ncbi:MAG: hypothetical protein ACKO91_14880 [Acidimicrobiales bacterium]
MSISRKHLRNGLAGLTLAASTLGGGVFLANSANAQTAGTSGNTAVVAGSRPDPFADALKKLVDAGTITQAQADAVTTALRDARPAGPHGKRGPRGPKGNPQIVADALGITLDELATARQAGTTIAALAQTKNIPLDTVITKIANAEKAEIQAKVTAGDLTQTKADEILTNLTQRITDMVNGVKPTGAPNGPMRPKGPKGDHADRGPRNAQPNTPTNTTN